jgi:DNA-binding MarR family transcriptional regulator|tara:strand:+ start:1039 stop:1515 length:477 start_codon:yes stop_codon:yes gene_type:complete
MIDQEKSQYHSKEELVIDEFLPYLLAHASNIISRQIDEIALAQKISRNKCKVLLTLIDSDGVSLNELADIMIIKQPTLSRIVETMVEAGWLERKVLAQDRRAVNIRLTKLGLKQAQPVLLHARKMDALIQKSMGITASKKLKKLLIQLTKTNDIPLEN